MVSFCSAVDPGCQWENTYFDKPQKEGEGL